MGVLDCIAPLVSFDGPSILHRLLAAAPAMRAGECDIRSFCSRLRNGSLTAAL